MLRASILPNETKSKALSEMSLGHFQTVRIAKQSQCASTIGFVNLACVPDAICFQPDEFLFSTRNHFMFPTGLLRGIKQFD